MSYDTLTRYEQNLQPQPMLVESWEVSADAKQIKLNLRQAFSSTTDASSPATTCCGTSCASATRRSAWRSSPTRAPGSPTFRPLNKCTVILKSDARRPAVFDVTEYLNILGQYVHFARTKSYWQSGQPSVDDVQVNILGDQQSMVTSLEGGALDGIINPPVRDSAHHVDQIVLDGDAERCSVRAYVTRTCRMAGRGRNNTLIIWRGTTLTRSSTAGAWFIQQQVARAWQGAVLDNVRRARQAPVTA